MSGLLSLQQGSLRQSNDAASTRPSLDAATSGRAPLHVPTPLWNLSNVAERHELLHAAATPNVGSVQPAQANAQPSIDTLVLDAHHVGHFPGTPNFRYDHPGGVEQLFYIYSDGTVQDAQVRMGTISCNGASHVSARPTVQPDPARTLVAIAHTHQDRSTGEAFPGGGDGFTPALRQVPNYVLSSHDVFVVRPDASRGVSQVDHLRGHTPFARSDQSHLQQNALRALQSQLAGQAPSVCR